MITLKQARDIIDAALAKGRELGLKPLTVVVLDHSGEIKASAREDGSSRLRPAIAEGKARGALSMEMSSRALADLAEARPNFFATLVAAAGGRMVAAAGGVLVMADSGIVGAVGISGDLSDQDEACAIAGIEAAGLKAG
jgi:uncharacterized protein GlcG (DUF336 family)